MGISLKPEPIEYIGKLETFEKVVGDYGEQIKIQMKPANPEAVSYKFFFFPYNKTGNSKLNKFTRSFSKCSGKPADDSDVFIGVWARVQEIPTTWEDRDGITHDGKDYLVAEIYEGEAMAMASWRAKQPAAEKVTAPEPVPFDEPKPVVVPVPDAIAVVLKTMYIAAGSDKEKLWTMAQSMGFTKMQVLSAVDEVHY